MPSHILFLAILCSRKAYLKGRRNVYFLCFPISAKICPLCCRFEVPDDIDDDIVDTDNPMPIFAQETVAEQDEILEV